MYERSHFDDAGSRAVLATRSREFAAVNGIDQSMLSIFQQSWWLEIARGTEHYREATVLKDGVLVGSLPYVLRRTKLGIRWGACPDWSHIGGPVVCQSLSEEEKSDVLDRLIAQLPANVSFGFACGPHPIDTPLFRHAFTSAGFSHSTVPTYSQTPSQADVLGRVRRKRRKLIESARRKLDVVEIDEYEFIDFYSANMAEVALAAGLPLDIARALIAKGRVGDRRQVRVVAAKAKQADGRIDAAIACVWDKTRYYYWMSARRRHSADRPADKPHPGANKLLIVDAMAHAQSLGLIFDADGCGTPGAEKLYKQVLRIPNQEFRDIFERETRLGGWYRAQRDRLEKFAAFQFARRLVRRGAMGWRPGRIGAAA
jgi:hypothetical protein